MDIRIQAHNPKGLDYDHLAGSPKDAKDVVRRIIAQGGEKITLNGREIPRATIDFIRGI